MPVAAVCKPAADAFKPAGMQKPAMVHFLRFKPGVVFEAGIAVVIIAYKLDRITQKVGKYNK